MFKLSSLVFWKSLILVKGGTEDFYIKVSSRWWSKLIYFNISLVVEMDFYFKTGFLIAFEISVFIVLEITESWKIIFYIRGF